MQEIADGPQHRLHKGSKRYLKAASGFNPSRGPGRGLHREWEKYGGGRAGSMPDHAMGATLSAAKRQANEYVLRWRSLRESNPCFSLERAAS